MRRLKSLRLLLASLALASVGLLGTQCGLTVEAFLELQAAGVDKYLGQFTPVSSTPVGGGWTQHTFDTDGGNGPLCIAGTPYSVFSKQGNPSKLLIFLQGGGACWQDFYFCNIVVGNNPLPPFPQVDQAGIWNADNPDNPFADYSVLYMPYCDGSVFSGDNDVVDANFPFGPVRFHRGLRNQSAGADLAKELFPNAKRITVAGSSAGGNGIAGFTPFLVRFLYGNTVRLTAFNDAGPVAINLDEVGAIAARAADWQFGQFYPASCTDCDDMGQPTALIDWRLANDLAIREAFYSTDGDATDRFFLNIATQEEYRELLLAEHGALNDAYPNRYKSFIKSGDDSHTALQTPRFYTQTVDGVSLDEWTSAFLVPKPPFWQNLVEDFIPLP